MHSRFLLTCILLVFLTACAATTATPAPSTTPMPVPSVTIQPTPVPTETATSSPTIEVVPPTPENSSTPETLSTLEPTMPPIPTFEIPPTPGATSLPQPEAGSSAIQIYSPGPQSKLVSTFIVNGYAIPGYGNKGLVTLYGEDGRVIASKLLQLNTAYTWAYFYGTLTFEIQAVGELGRLTMTTQDQYGRLTAVNSVHVILLSEGLSIINPPGDLEERVVIDLPVTGRRISGGMLTVAGEMRPYNALPLVVELVARDGGVIASQAVVVSPARDDSYIPFRVDLPYSISNGTWARLVLVEPDDRIAGTMYLYSREIYLNP